MAFQIQPCDKSQNCSEWDNHSLALPLLNCTREKQEELSDYWTPRRNETHAKFLAENAKCIDRKNAYIAGEPGTYSEASIVIGYEIHPNISTDENSPDYDIDKHYYYYYNNPFLHITYNQLQIRSGTFQKVDKIFEVVRGYNIHLSQDTFVNKNDYIGMIHSEPEQHFLI